MKIIIFIIALLMPFMLNSQDVKKHIKSGNKLYKDKKYSEAEVEYRKAQEVDPKETRAGYNTANSLYKQNKYD
jgi:Flp pilus assembly protein TadD